MSRANGEPPATSDATPPPPLSPLQLRALDLVGHGSSVGSVARELRVSKQRAARIVKNLVGLGFIALDPTATALQRHALGNGRIVVYQLTVRGETCLGRPAHDTGGVSYSSAGEATPPRVADEPRVEVHNFEVKVPVVSGRIAWLPHERPLNSGVVRRWDSDFHGLYLEVVEGRRVQTVLLRASGEAPAGVVNGREVAERLCHRKLTRALRLLEEEYRLVLGVPEFRLEYREGRAKIGVLGHPLRGALPSFERGVLASVDATPEVGTIHPRDPSDADRLVLMARNVETTLRTLEELVVSQRAFLEAATRILEGQAGLLQNLSLKSALPSSLDERRDVA